MAYVFEARKMHLSILDILCFDCFSMDTGGEICHDWINSFESPCICKIFPLLGTFVFVNESN